jgi:SAM-dependent methyltransferase
MVQYKNNSFDSSVKEFLKMIKFRYTNRQKVKYECSICKYFGPFHDINTTTGVRRNAKCPRCGSLERHRLQKIVLDKLAAFHDFSKMKFLHFAPEPCFRQYFQEQAQDYISIDLHMDKVTLNADIQSLPFKDSFFDLVFASHVLEHVKMDHIALSEIKRVLSDRGIAILPVPIVAENTIEYPEPNPSEAGHIRAPGHDYFDRFKNYFSHIEIYSSKDVSPAYQTFILEERDHWPTEQMPLRKPMMGGKHIDIVPVCFA